jgi:antitoxin PrlF
MSESTISSRGQTTIPAEIRRAIGGGSSTRLVWWVIAVGRLSVRVKSKSAVDVKGIVKVPKGLRLEAEEMRP